MAEIDCLRRWSVSGVNPLSRASRGTLLALLLPSRAYIRFPDELDDEDSRVPDSVFPSFDGPICISALRAIEQANQRIVDRERKGQARVDILLLLGFRGGERNQPGAMESSAALKERVCVHFC